MLVTNAISVYLYGIVYIETVKEIVAVVILLENTNIEVIVLVIRIAYTDNE